MYAYSTIWKHLVRHAKSGFALHTAGDAIGDGAPIRDARQETTLEPVCSLPNISNCLHRIATTRHDFVSYKVDIRFAQHDANTSSVVSAISHKSRHESFTSSIFPVTYFPCTYHFNHASLPSHIFPVTYFTRRVFSRHESFQSPPFSSRIFLVTYIPVMYHFNRASFHHVYFRSRIFPSLIISVCIFTVTYISRHLLSPTRILTVVHFRHASFSPHIQGYS